MGGATQEYRLMLAHDGHLPSERESTVHSLACIGFPRPRLQRAHVAASARPRRALLGLLSSKSCDLNRPGWDGVLVRAPKGDGAGAVGAGPVIVS